MDTKGCGLGDANIRDGGKGKEKKEGEMWEQEEMAPGVDQTHPSDLTAGVKGGRGQISRWTRSQLQ